MKQIRKVARVKLEFKPRFATGLPLLVLSGLLTEPETVGHCQACLLLPRSSHLSAYKSHCMEPCTGIDLRSEMTQEVPQGSSLMTSLDKRVGLVFSQV